MALQHGAFRHQALEGIRVHPGRLAPQRVAIAHRLDEIVTPPACIELVAQEVYGDLQTFPSLAVLYAWPQALDQTIAVHGRATMHHEELQKRQGLLALPPFD